MNRTEALKFIRQNSRCSVSLCINPLQKEDKMPNGKSWDEEYEPNYLEHRLTNNGKPFILQDMGKHGWDIFTIIGGNEVAATIDKFKEYSGIQ